VDPRAGFAPAGTRSARNPVTILTELPSCNIVRYCKGKEFTNRLCRLRVLRTKQIKLEWGKI